MKNWQKYNKTLPQLFGNPKGKYSVELYIKIMLF